MSGELLEIIGRFGISGELISIKENKTGHINSTYFLKFRDGENETKYVLQKINTYVFKNPEQLMSNIVGVTDYLRNVIAAEGGDAERGTLRFIASRDGRYFTYDSSGGCYRVYRFIDGVISYQLADTKELFYRAGLSFGDFQRKLARYDASALYETIPDFHNTKKRFERFLRVVSLCGGGREKIAKREIDFVRERKEVCSFIVDGIEEGIIPVRVTHNDTKLNNILMDKVSGEGVCVIDLDTVMPGSALYDFGDAIRFGASSALEDERDLSKVFFSTDMFEAFAAGYLKGTGGELTDYEIKSLTMGALIITLETGMRFLTDYLENDIYFRTEYEDHNLIRARNQFKLVSDIETRFDEFVAIIKKLSRDK